MADDSPKFRLAEIGGMRLTRRDALAALAGLTVVGGGGAAVLSRDPLERDPPADVEAVLPTLVAAAEVLYPTEVEGIEGFVGTFVRGRVREEAHRRRVVRAAREVDEAARSWYGGPYPALDRADRDGVLRELGADSADPVPDGTTAERVRHAVVNELLYALYTSPAGGRLVGTENPLGHPGGTASYRRGPDGER
jgi:hypothetical protein